jgi:hypothetical protein
MGGAICRRRECSSQKSLSRDLAVILFITASYITASYIIYYYSGSTIVNGKKEEKKVQEKYI